MSDSRSFIAAVFVAGAVGCSSGETGKGGPSSGDGGTTPPRACVTSGRCNAASCASGGCFDADRCAKNDVSFWRAQWNENVQSIAVTSRDERVLVGISHLGNATEADRDLFVTKLSASGTELWSRQLGTTGGDYGMAVTVDASDFIYVTGASEGAFDGHAASGGRDVLVLKLGPDGATVWSALFGSAGGDTGMDLTLDRQGNVLVAGGWNFDFAASTRQAFVAKIGPDGALLQNTQLAADYGEAATIDVDAQGNIFVTGEKQQPGATILGTGNVFAKKIAPDGSEAWSLEWASDRDDWTNAAVLDERGQLYVVGTTAGALEGNPAPKTGDWSAFLSLVDASGKLAWTRTYHPDFDTRGGDLALAKNGDLLLAGSVLGELTLEGETLGADTFTMRLCPDGSPMTLQQWDFGSDDWTYALTEAADGTVLLSGYSFQTVAMGAPQDSVDTFLISVRPE